MFEREAGCRARAPSGRPRARRAGGGPALAAVRCPRSWHPSLEASVAEGAAQAARSRLRYRGETLQKRRMTEGHIPRLIDRGAVARPAGARGPPRAGDVPARSRGRGYGRAARRGAARLQGRRRCLDAGGCSSRPAAEPVRRRSRASACSIPTDEALQLGASVARPRALGLALHFANDLPGVLAQIRRALRPDGLFLAALLGGDTLTELQALLYCGGSGARGRAVAARAAVRRFARSRRAVAARGLRASGRRRRPRGRALRQRLRADAGFAAHGRDQCADANAAARHCAVRRCCAWRRSMPNVLPTATDASAPRSISSGSRAGRRMRASSSR